MIKGSLLLSAPIVKHFSGEKVQCVLGQNLRDLASSDFYLFPLLKEHLSRPYASDKWQLSGGARWTLLSDWYTKAAHYLLVGLNVVGYFKH